MIKILKLRSQNGFTMLELIVVFTVIAILSTIGIASFVNYSRAQSLQTGAQDLFTTLNLAKSRTLSQVKPDLCSTTETLDGYKVTIDYSGNSNEYKLYVICSTLPHEIKSSILPTNISFDGSGTPIASVLFRVITGGVDLKDASDAPIAGIGTIKINGYSSQSKTIQIDTGGNVSVQ